MGGMPGTPRQLMAEIQISQSNVSGPLTAINPQFLSQMDCSRWKVGANRRRSLSCNDAQMRAARD
jgi:hypothetical protein